MPDDGEPTSQDFMARRGRRPKTFAEALEVTAEVYHAAGAMMAERGLLQGVADEGGWWPAFSTNEEALRRASCGRLSARGLLSGRGRSDLGLMSPRRGIWPRRPVSAGPGEARARPRRPDRHAASMSVPAIPFCRLRDPFAEDDDEGFRQFIAPPSATPHSGDRRRLSAPPAQSARARRSAPAQRQCGSCQGQSGGNGQRSQSRLRRGSPFGLGHNRLRAFGGDRGPVSIGSSARSAGAPGN